jgi:mRNA interferase MazF
MMFNQGDIVIIPVPFTDNSGYKLRPAVVVSNNSVHQSGDIMIVQITSKFKNDNLNLPLGEIDVTEPLPVQSFIRVHKLFVLEQRLVKGRVSSLKPEKYQQLVERIKAIIEPSELGA